MQNFIGSVFRFILKVVLAVFGLMFAVALIALALIVVLLSLLASLLTGKKPAPTAVFGRFQKFAPGGRWPGNTSAKPNADVVDIDAREVKDAPTEDKKLP